MIYYTEVCLSSLEVPHEVSICIYLSGCQNNCGECHYPQLRKASYGDVLHDSFKKIIDIYKSQATCVCFLGEGKGDLKDKNEIKSFVDYVHSIGLKACLYCGRDTDIEQWMKCFDYVKVGRYIREAGSLLSSTTNQRMYKKEEMRYVDITHSFFENNIQ